MLNQLAGYAYLVFLVLAPFSLLLPVGLMWRVAALAALALICGTIIRQPIHWTDMNAGASIGKFVLTLYAAVALLIFVGRLVWSAWKCRLTVTALRGPDTPARRALDQAVTALAGLVAGLVLSVTLARHLAGTTSGRTLDLSVAAIGLGLALALAALLRGPLRTAAVALSLTVGAVAGYGSTQSGRIPVKAAALAEGRPFCLASGQSDGTLNNLSQLGFFSLPKRPGTPHLALLIRDGERLEKFHWSVRLQSFRPGLIDDTGTCDPRTDFAAALRTGDILPRRVAVGASVFTVPDTDTMLATPRRLTLTSPVPPAPGGIAIPPGITLSFDDRPYPRLPDALPLSELPGSSAIDIDALASGKARLHVVGPDDRGRDIRIDCLMGAWADRLCEVQVTEGRARITFRMPVMHLQDWSRAADHVTALFDAMKDPR
ncbi:hypothetical protein GCM10011360_06890 [Primorskyibacter flagellatus]|uniref:Uncharacterized protein n=1 Tax=Primorskyibacter flagellatus TaxID=1387277 RepID=A0A917A181_9RHOB|nr:hypothetical protein [Primorskyibacter flagellatus]GGE20849.1 hypothetical protein GCM10011360_06890 [Primorskyibacter flagellatus]